MSCDPADSVFPGEPWGSKLRTILTGAACSTHFLRWEDVTICSGEIVAIQDDEVKVELFPFEPYRGFCEDEKTLLYDLCISNLSSRSIKITRNCWIVCAGKADFALNQNRVHFGENTVLQHRPELSSHMAWDACHMFCGAFEGWSRAMHWLCGKSLEVAFRREVHIDHCPRVMNTWSKNHCKSFHRAPLDPATAWDSSRHVGVLACVGDLSCLHAVETQVNSILTCSPPCVSWSAGGKGLGLASQEGWSFVNCVRASVILQPHMLALECADKIDSHPHLPLLEKLLHLVGFTLIWKQIVPLQPLTHNARTRWLSVWTRSGEVSKAICGPFRLPATMRVPWSAESYMFPLPAKLRDQLFLHADELAVYGDWTLLPPAKRAKHHNADPEMVLSARLVSDQEPLPTLCANYTVQHTLHASHLQQKGIFACLQHVDNRYAFLDPVTSACLLGPTSSITMPLLLEDAFHHLGNVIAVPHALLALLIGLVSLLPIDVNIIATVQACWNDRLTRKNALLVCEEDSWTLLLLDQLRDFCKLQDPGLIVEERTRRFQMRTSTQEIIYVIPVAWTQVQFFRRILALPETLFRFLSLDPDSPVCPQDDMAQIAERCRFFGVCLGNMEFASGCVLPCPEDQIVPPTLPYPIEGLVVDSPRTIKLDTPDLEDFFDSALGIGVIRYIEKTADRGIAYNQCKHEVFVALPSYPAILRIAVSPLSVMSQIRVLADELGCPHISRPVHTLHPGRDVFVLHEAQPAHRAVLFDIQGQPEDIYTQRVPATCDKSCSVQIRGEDFSIKYLNNMNHASGPIALKDADVLTLSKSVHVGGHHAKGSSLSLPKGSDFEMRCLFVSETHGWLASDELHFATVHLAWCRPQFAHFTGPALWDTAVDQWHPINLDLSFPNRGKSILPLLVDNHWTALEINSNPTLVTVACIGLSPHLAPRVPQILQILAAWLAIQPGNIRVYCRTLAQHPHMCGWMLLHRWFVDAGIVDNIPDLEHEISLLPDPMPTMLDVAMTDSVCFWQTTTAPSSVKQLAYRLRQNHLITLAQTSCRSLEVTDHRLLTHANQYEVPASPKPVDFDSAIQERLDHFINHPGWLASDELDFLLEPLRCLTTSIVFLPPAKWTHRASLSFFEGLQPNVQHAAHCICFILVDQHWIHVEIQQMNQQVFVILSAPQFRSLVYPLRIAVARLFEVQAECVRLVHVFVTAPQGLCGWSLLRDLFARYNATLQPLRQMHINMLQASTLAFALTKVRNDSCAAWISAATDTHLQIFAHNSRGLFLLRVLEGRLAANYEAGGAVDSAQPGQASNEPPAAPGSTQNLDPLWLKDPWARPTKQKHTKWEDLTLPPNHPFLQNGTQHLSQTHRVEAANKREGIVLTTKAYVTEMCKIPTTKTLALLLPPTDLTSLGGLASKLLGPYEIIVNDGNLQTSYKRLGVVLPISGNVTYQLPKPTCKFTAKESAELVLELDSRLLASAEFQQATESPIQTFRKLIRSIHTALPESVVLYGLKKGRHPTSAKDDVQLQCMTRVPKDTRKSILEQSGTHGLLIRDFLERGKNTDDATVLPKFWAPTIKELHDIQICVKHIEGRAGIILTKRGLALCVWTAKIAEARKALLPGDPRLTSENLHVVPRIVMESSGWPAATEAAHVITSVLKATGNAPVPTKAFRAAGVHGWTLAFDTRPTTLKFSVDINGSTYEILLTDPQMPSFKNGGRAQPVKAPKQHVKSSPTPPDEPVPVYPAAVVKHPESERIDRLEARMNQLDTRQSRLETQLNSRFDEVGAQLQKILSNTMPARPREPMGDTPPPKCPRNQQ